MNSLKLNYMHRLQQHILSQLILNTTQRYADLKPADVEGNLFMYHLRCLMKEGRVEKCPDARYKLSAGGMEYVDRLSLKSLTPRIQPRIVTLMAVQDRDNRWLMYRRKRQPLINTIGFPYGKIHLDEKVYQAAHRELHEKTGLKAELTHYGDGYASVYQDDKAVSQIMFHLFYGKNPAGDLRGESSIGQSIWLTKEEIMNSSDVMANVVELLRLIELYNGQRFFVELEHRI